MNKKMLVIINPCAGRTKSQSGTFDIVDVLSGLNYDFNLKTTTKRGDATEYVRELGANYDVVLCVGGDGTLNETVNGVMQLEKRLPVGYIPTGSTNDLATTIGIPSDIRKAVELIATNQKNTYDIGKFNDRHFCYIASFGVGTEFSYSTPQKLKNVMGYSAYMLNTFVLNGPKLLKSIKPIHAVIEHDGITIEDDFYFGGISNSTSVGGLFTFDRNDVKLNDGIFEVLLVRRISSLANAVQMLRKMQKHDYNNDQMIFFHTDNLKIHMDKPVGWTLDGEFGGKPEDIDFSVAHDGVEIFSPGNDLFLK